MTDTEIKAELNQLDADWKIYLDTTPYEIKHRVGADYKTDILRTYSKMIARKQELYRMHYENHRHIAIFDI